MGYYVSHLFRKYFVSFSICFILSKWDITYLIEKLPHEDNTSMWNGEKLERVGLDLDSDVMKKDLVRMDSINS